MIRLYKISKIYAGERYVLRDVSLQVGKGEFVLITGPTGSGKSTLLKVLFGAEEPTSGRGVVNGRNIMTLDRPTLAELRRELGLVFQDSRLIDRLSIIENVAIAADVAGVPHAEARTRAREALERTGLVNIEKELPVGLSAGERQRVSLARALVNRPVLLLADEPTANLDPDASEEIIALLRQVHGDGTTVVVATHDQDALSLLHCRTLLMYEARLFEEDDPRIVADL